MTSSVESTKLLKPVRRRRVNCTGDRSIWGTGGRATIPPPRPQVNPNHTMSPPVPPRPQHAPRRFGGLCGAPGASRPGSALRDATKPRPDPAPAKLSSLRRQSPVTNHPPATKGPEQRPCPLRRGGCARSAPEPLRPVQRPQGDHKHAPTQAEPHELDGPLAGARPRARPLGRRRRPLRSLRTGGGRGRRLRSLRTDGSGRLRPLRPLRARRRGRHRLLRAPPAGSGRRDPCAACDPCAAMEAACGPCDPCAPMEAAADPCAAATPARPMEAAACDPCAPMAPAACDPCAPAAACGPCDPCAAAAPPPELSDDELDRALRLPARPHALGLRRRVDRHRPGLRRRADPAPPPRRLRRQRPRRGGAPSPTGRTSPACPTRAAPMAAAW
jgi:hypothetical protein